jgi:pyrrolysine biosynthesis protein PylC
MFEKMAVQLARKLKLRGIMDVEVIRHGRDLKLLEIDARFPSQTPMAVFWSSGLNMVQVLADLFLLRSGQPSAPQDERRGVLLEHVRCVGSLLEVGGEHLMGGRGSLHIESGFCGADDAVTDYAPGKRDWVATLIHCGPDLDAAREKRNRTVAAIRDRFGIREYRDPFPDEGCPRRQP